MSNYLTRFQSHSDYEAAASALLRPNVSACVNEDEVHYNPWVETRLIAKFNVTSTSEPTKIGYNAYTSAFTEIEIDGVVQPNVVSSYTFDTTGEHVVKYTLSDATSIGPNALRGCTTLTSVTIPTNVTSISGKAFNNCNSLVSVTIPDSITSIGNSAFNRCTSLTGITIPDSVTNIGDSAFFQCSGLTSVIIGSGVTSIGESVFAYCHGITSIGNIDSGSDMKISNNMTYIGKWAFSGCTGLTTIELPNSITGIGASFAACKNLTSITSLATVAPTISISTFLNVKTGGTLYVPIGATGYDTWMGTGDYYLGKYNWTKVEQ